MDYIIYMFSSAKSQLKIVEAVVSPSKTSHISTIINSRAKSLALPHPGHLLITDARRTPPNVSSEN